MEQADAAMNDDSAIAPMVAAREVLRPLPDGFLLVDEAPCANPFTQPMHRSTGGRQYFHNRGGGLGWGMPAAVGVSLARDHAPVVCMVGDGSAMYSPQALWSAVHEDVPVVYVVLNNLEYGILKNFMVSQPQYNSNQHGFLAMDITQPKVDFPSLAKSMGVAATLVSSHREISEAVEAAIRTGKPHLIEVPVKGIGGRVNSQ
jgi:benzoylformate decarboxylase